MVYYPWETTQSCWISVAPTRWEIPPSEPSSPLLPYTIEFELIEYSMNEDHKDSAREGLRIDVWVNDQLAVSKINIGQKIQLRIKNSEFSAFLNFYNTKNRIFAKVQHIHAPSLPSTTASIYPRYHYAADIQGKKEDVIGTVSYSFQWKECLVCDTVIVEGKQECAALKNNLPAHIPLKNNEGEKKSLRIEILVARANGLIPASTQIPAFEDEVRRFVQPPEKMSEGCHNRLDVLLKEFAVKRTGAKSMHVKEWIPVISLKEIASEIMSRLDPVGWLFGDLPQRDKKRLHLFIASVRCTSESNSRNIKYLLIEILSCKKTVVCEFQTKRSSTGIFNEWFHIEIESRFTESISFTIIEESEYPLTFSSAFQRRSPKGFHCVSRTVGSLEIDLTNWRNHKRQTSFLCESWNDQEVYLSINLSVPTEKLFRRAPYHPMNRIDGSLFNWSEISIVPLASEWTLNSLFEYVIYMPELRFEEMFASDLPFLTLEESIDFGKCPRKQKNWILFQLFVSLQNESVLFVNHSIVVTYDRALDSFCEWNVLSRTKSSLDASMMVENVISGTSIYSFKEIGRADLVLRQIIFPSSILEHHPVSPKMLPTKFLTKKKSNRLFCEEFDRSVTQEIESRLAARFVICPEIDLIEIVCKKFSNPKERRIHIEIQKEIIVEEISFGEFQEIEIELFLKKLKRISLSQNCSMKSYLHAFPNFNLLRIIFLY